MAESRRRTMIRATTAPTDMMMYVPIVLREVKLMEYCGVLEHGDLLTDIVYSYVVYTVVNLYHNGTFYDFLRLIVCIYTS